MRMHQFYICAVFAAVMSLFSLASAAEETTLYNVVSLQASVESEINNNQMIVVLAVEHENISSATVSEKINKEMKWALEQVKKHKDMQSQSMAYSVYPVYRNKKNLKSSTGYEQTITGWRGSQSVQIKSENISGLSKLTGELQSRMHVKQMSFAPTDAVRKAVEDRLIEEALNAYKRRAEIVRKNMRASKYAVLDLNINTGHDSGPMYNARHMGGHAQDSSVNAATAVSAGTSKIVVTVSGRVQMQ